jgi:hypothetical protein
MSTGEIIRTKFMNNIWMVICNSRQPKGMIRYHQDKNLVVDSLTVRSNLRTKMTFKTYALLTPVSLI